jgi:hypothetical protein
MIGSRLFAVLLLTALTLFPGRALAQADSSSLARDTHLFRRLFHQQGCKPLTDPDELSKDPRETVLVILGDPTILPTLGIDLGEYVRLGGSLLFATDRQLNARTLSDFGVTLFGIRGQAVLVAPPDGYHGLNDCPIVLPANSRLPLFVSGRRTLTRVATNRSGFLSISRQGSPLRAIAYLPPDAKHLDMMRRDNLDWPMEFAAAGGIGPGRVLIMADHSVFINIMLLPTDNDNLEFANNCVRWLTEEGRRQSVLFVDEGRGQNSFDDPMVPPPSVPLPPADKLVAALDQVFAGLEEENLFNELFAGLSRSIPKQQAITWSILSLSMMLGVYALFRVTSAKQRREAGIVPLAATIDKLELGRPIHEVRALALVEGGNYWDAAHELAIDIFEPLMASAGPGSRLKVFSDTPFSWKSWRERRQVRAVWRLAVDPKPKRWTRRQWLHLHALDPALRRDIASGKIILVSTSPVFPSPASQDALPKFHTAR